MLQKKILTVWNEKDGYGSLRSHLEKGGYELVNINNNKNVLDVTRISKPDLILLDINLFEMEGLDLCKTLRSCSTIPIIMLAESNDINDKIAGLDTGADDYITKPFSSLEVVARVRAVLRRNIRISVNRFACQN
jgi:DNA-binding response OmpR family regulator